MKKIIISFLIFVIPFFVNNCTQGTDASLLNNVNELVITGKNTNNYIFDHMTVEMAIHIYDNNDFTGVPQKRLSVKFTDIDNNNIEVAVNEQTVSFLKAISPGDYYAYAFIDINRNSKMDVGEPFDVWLNNQNTPKVIKVREESRWEILFKFVKTFNNNL
jgi:hypothetical protein